MVTTTMRNWRPILAAPEPPLLCDGWDRMLV
jgi:hypothetical protein